MFVSALLISHNGARWLPAVVDGIASQTRAPDRIAAVDTGSRDDTVHLLRRQPQWIVSRLDGHPPFAEAVEAGLDSLGGSGAPDEEGEEWVWLLHDDSAPAPDALDQLLAAAREHPEVAIFGSKLREWPSLRRLLELGVTISGTGQRETGLERGEFDQGQHDERRIVLAVNSAGMLIRRDVLTRLGFDPALPLFGNDIDLGWRAARAGEQTMVVPQAVVFHAEAAHRGQRRGAAARHHHRGQRAAAVHILLANSPARTVPFKAVRLLVGSLVRAVGLLLVRAPREAFDDLVGTLSVLVRPGRIIAGRRWRRRTPDLQVVDHLKIRHLLAPPWLPYRHGLDFLGDVRQAAVDTARERVGGRTIRSAALIAPDPQDDDAVHSSHEPGLLGLLARARTTWLVLGTFAIALVAGRDLFAGGALHGGSLLPAPGGVGHWWSTYVEAHHELGTGSGAPAPAYLLSFAALATLLLGHPSWLIAIFFLLGVPLSAMTALRFFRRAIPGAGSTSVAPFWGAVAYALLPILSGSVAQGRLGTVVGAIVLPLVATSALGLADQADQDRDRRWRAVWRTSIGLALLIAVVPQAWLVALVLALLWTLRGLVLHRQQWRRASWWAAPVTILLGSVLLNLPWLAGVIGHPGAWLVEAGAPQATVAHPGSWQVLAGGSGGPGQAPLWIGGCFLAAGVLALVRGSTRPRVLTAWVVALVAAGLAAVIARIDPSLPGTTASTRPWVGFLLLLAQAAIVAAAVFAGHDAVRFSRRSGPVVLRALVLAGTAIAVVATVAGAAWWAITGTAGPVPGPLHRGPVEQPPVYMAEVAQAQGNGVLVLRGNVGDGVTYQVLRDGPLRIGDDGIVDLTDPDDRLGAVVRRMLTDPDSDATVDLADFGIGYIFEKGPISPSISGTLDASAGLSRASAPRSDAAWRLQTTPDESAVTRDSQPGRGLLLVLQFVLVIAAISLALPSRRPA